jgi:hypothetical protein
MIRICNLDVENKKYRILVDESSGNVAIWKIRMQV